MKLAGLDIGTTGCKCTVFDENGKYLNRAYRDYPVVRSLSGHEIDISGIMNGVYAVLSEMAALYPDIEGIGVTSFGETFVMVDDDGNPLHPAMLYTDPRGAEECAELIEKLGEKQIGRITGVRPHEMYSISKMMWIKRHEPEIYKKAKRVHLIGDYVVRHLTHTAQIDYSLAARTMAFDIQKLKWSDEIFAAAEIDASLMSKPVKTGSSAGEIIAEIADKTGLSKETKIISVSHDQVAAAVGAGAFDSKTAVDGAGTVECLTPVYDVMPDMDAMFNGRFAVVPYVIPGKYVAYAFSYTGGALLQWCTGELAKKEVEASKEQGISVNQYLESSYSGKRPTGLLVLPHFAGAATPYMDTGSKGVIAGLTTASKLNDIYVACMEGVAYEMKVNYEALKPSGVRFDCLNATGGGAKSPMFMQIKADVLGMPIRALKTTDAGTVGSAMLTGIATGVFDDLSDAVSHMVEETALYEPDPENHKKYLDIYENYKKLYSAVRPLV